MSSNTNKSRRYMLRFLVLCTGLILLGAQNVNAQLFGAPAFSAWGCGFINTSPAVYHMDDEWGFLVVSTTTTALKPNVDDLSILRHFYRLQRVNPMGVVLWSRNVSVQSHAIATITDANPPYPASFWISERLELFNHRGNPWALWSRQCLNITQVKIGANWFFVMVVGTSAASGGDSPQMSLTQNSGTPSNSGTEAVVVGSDKTIEKVVVIRASNGTVARTLNFKPQPGWYTIALGSGVMDMNNNDIPEFVLTRGRFIGENRYDTRVESWNLLTGKMENSTILTQNNLVKIQGE